MADEVNEKEGSPELETEEQNLPEIDERGQNVVPDAGAAEPEDTVQQGDEELARTSTRIVELEQLIAGKDDDIAALKQAEVELQEKLTTTGDSLAEAVAAYKVMVVQANPEVIEELISGDTIEGIDESLRQAKALVSKVRQGLETEISLTKVPAGAPERTLPDFSALSPREKIQYAVGSMK